MDEGLPLRSHGDEGGGVDVRAVLPEGGVLGREGGEPCVERLRVEVAPPREGEEGDGAALVLAPCVDDAGGPEARRDRLDDPAWPAGVSFGLRPRNFRTSAVWAAAWTQPAPATKPPTSFSAVR